MNVAQAVARSVEIHRSPEIEEQRLIGFRSKLRFDSLAPECFALHAFLREMEYVCDHLIDDVFETESIVAIPDRACRKT